MFDILGIDWGKSRFGLAFGDESTKLIIAANYPCTANQIWEILDKEIKSRKIKKIVVGMPTNFAGQKTEVSLLVQDFIDKLQAKYPEIKLATVNERSSSKVFANQKVDKYQINHLAAAKILEFYFGIESSF